jgi:hypothetical protein
MAGLVHSDRKGPWITVGGGIQHGIFDVLAISDILSSVTSIGVTGYSGIVLDV